VFLSLLVLLRALVALRAAIDGFDIALNDLPNKHEQITALAVELKALEEKLA
jgi:hypothetical protein